MMSGEYASPTDLLLDRLESHEEQEANNATQLEPPAGREVLRQALIVRMNEALLGSGHQVVWVSYTNFVLTA